MEPATGEILWKYKLKGALYNMFPLRGTPFTMLKMRNGDLILINLEQGNSINISDLMVGNIESYYLIPESYDLLVYSKSPAEFHVIDLFSLDVRWHMKTDFSDRPSESKKSNLDKFGAAMNANNGQKKSKQKKKSKFGAALSQLSEMAAESMIEETMLDLECPPVSNKAGGIIIAGRSKLTNIDPKGNVIWQIDQPKYKNKKGKVSKMIDNNTELLLDAIADQFYILKSRMINALKISDGSTLWPNFFKINGNEIVQTDQGLVPLNILIPSDEGTLFSKTKLNLLDPTNGKPIWPSELELKGSVDDYRILPNGDFAVVTLNATNSKFQIIDLKQGKFKFNEEINLKGRVRNFVIGKEKMLFETNRGIDLIDRNPGGDLLPKMQKFAKDADIVTLFKEANIYSIDAKNKKVFKTDLINDQSQQIIRNFKFQAGEQLSKYDVLENGDVFLASDHHFQLFSSNGEKLIDKPFDYQGRGWDRFDRAMEITERTFSVINTATAFAVSAAAIGIGVQIDDAAQESFGTGIGAGAYALDFSESIVAPELVNNRILKNQRAAKYYLGLKRMKKDPSEKGSFFVRRIKELKANYLSYVSKSTGEIIFDIPLAKDAENPEFVISQQTGFLFYAPSFSVDTSSYKSMFVKKDKNAAAKDKMGFIAGYQF